MKARWLSLAAAAIPAALFFKNLRAYRRTGEGINAGVSVLIPARDEEANIGAAVESALANCLSEMEVIVLDDASTDGTARIVREIAARDPRVRLETAPALPAGWNGKQHACAVLAEHARFATLIFMDADVRLAPDALGRMAGFLSESGAQLASGVPRQEVGTFSEGLLLPLIHFVLLGFLPIGRMRRSTAPAYAAGCGQLFIADAEAYRRCGGHDAIHAAVHDGIALPRAFRQAGFRTDLFDATEVATCRMYRTNGDVWRGLSKNAHEGLGAPARIGVWTALLFAGQVLPFLLRSPLGIALALAPRLAAARRFHQPLWSALAHPAGIVALLGIQWWSLVRRSLGARSRWKGRDL